eukprot:9374154-Alexandrium_andersonii.AAC.1
MEPAPVTPPLGQPSPRSPTPAELQAKVAALNDLLHCVTAMQVPEAVTAMNAAIESVKFQINSATSPEQSL